jgi:tetratricopeptide (TPR) repeat protein
VGPALIGKALASAVLTGPVAACPPAQSGRAGLLVFLLGLALAIGTVGHDFVWDDHTQIERSQFVAQARSLPRFFTDDLRQLTFGAGQLPYYRPLYWVSFVLDRLAWGLRPAGFHLTNALLYALACLLVFRLARTLLGREEPALLAAALFAAHPAHVETIAWIAARNEAMAGIGVLLAVLGYLRARGAAGGRRAALLLGSLAAFGLGLLSKETALGLPLLLAWAEVVLRGGGLAGGRAGLGGAAARLAPFFALALGFLAFRWEAVAQWTAEAVGPAPLGQRLPGALELVARYALLAVWPLGLQPVYLLSRPASPFAPWPLAGLGLGLLIGGLALAWRRSAPAASFGLGWFLLALGPVLDLVPVAGRPLNFAARYLFLPTVGLALLAGAALARLPAARPRLAWAAGAAGALVFLGWTAQTLTYLPVFRDDLSLFGRVARDLPGLALGHHNLGLALLRAGRTPEGLEALERAVGVAPGDGLAQLALAEAYVATGRAAEGVRLLDALAPGMGETIKYIHTRAAAHLRQAEWRAAAEVLARGLRRYPEAGDLHFLLGHAWEQLGDLPRAEEAYRRALALHPGLPGGRVSLALLLLRRDRPAEAAAAAREALRAEPDSAAAWRALALALGAAGDRTGSRRAWERVIALDETPAARAEAQEHLSAGGGAPGAAPGRRP